MEVQSVLMTVGRLGPKMGKMVEKMAHDLWWEATK